MMSKIYALRQILYKFELVFLKCQCWLIGHDERWGSRINYESDWCARCHCEWPQEKVTLPKLLNRGYVWIVKREWAWLETLDLWLRDYIRLPSWWEY